MNNQVCATFAYELWFFFQMSAAIGIPRVVNKQIRTTAIQNMKEGGLDDRFIQTATKHKVLATLQNYDPQFRSFGRAFFDGNIC